MLLIDQVRQELLDAIGGRPISSILNDPAPDYLFENCFRNNSITVFVAPPHASKTFLMLDMALCLDMEMPLFGAFMPLLGHQSLYIGVDSPSWDMALQVRKLCIGHGISPEERAMLSIDGVWGRTFNINAKFNLEWLKAYKDYTGCSVLFLDTHRSTHHANENDSTEMERVWDDIKRLRDNGWCIIMSHHTSKPKEIISEDINAARGSSVIGASADFLYVISKPGGRGSPTVYCKCVKGRGSAGDDDVLTGYKLVSVPSTEELHGRPLNGVRLDLLDTSPAPESSQVMDLIMTKLGEAPQSRQTLASALSKVSVFRGVALPQLLRVADNRIQQLKSEGRISRVGAYGLWRLHGVHNQPAQGLSEVSPAVELRSHPEAGPEGNLTGPPSRDSLP